MTNKKLIIFTDSGDTIIDEATQVRDEREIVLKTGMGTLNVHGQNLQLKNLSLEGGQVAVDGNIAALIFEEPRQERKWRLFR